MKTFAFCIHRAPTPFHFLLTSLHGWADHQVCAGVLRGCHLHLVQYPCVRHTLSWQWPQLPPWAGARCVVPAEQESVWRHLLTWVSTQGQLVGLVWFSFLSHHQHSPSWASRSGWWGLIRQCWQQSRSEALHFLEVTFWKCLGFCPWISNLFFGLSSSRYSFRVGSK